MTVLKIEFRDPYIYYLVDSHTEAREIIARANQYGAMVKVEVRPAWKVPESAAVSGPEDEQC